MTKSSQKLSACMISILFLMTTAGCIPLLIGATAGADDWDFPDRVILFQRNLENISPDPETLSAEIRDTLLHEVGHHFGMDEDTLREIEDPH